MMNMIYKLYDVTNRSINVTVSRHVAGDATLMENAPS
jgi:hypothetical protein